MMENTVSLETLKVENYSMESGLTPVNRRTVDKMFHYIHSFPLDEYDVELIRKDIIGMAMEGEQRNEPLHMMIGKKPRDFCNDLIYAIAGFTVPGGRAFLFAAGWFYRIMGGLYYLFAGWSILSLLLGWLMNRGTKDAIPLGNIGLLLFFSVIFIAIGWLYRKAGYIAKKYCGDAAHANLCMKWGKGILGFEIGFMILNNVLNFTAGIAVDATHTSANPAAIQIFSLIPYVFLAFYIIGAYENKKSA